MRFSSMFSSLIALLMASAVHAAVSPVVKDFKKHQNVVVDSLVGQGYSKMGPLDLEVLHTKMTDDSVRVVDSIDPGFARTEPNPRGNESRDTAEWFHDKVGNFIILSRADWPNASEEAKQILPVHEYLGPLGIQDHDCQISCAMWLLAQPELANKLSDSERALIETHIGELAMNGGVTGVGGGGDSRPIEAKVSQLKVDIDRLSNVKDPIEREAVLKSLLRYADSPFKIFPPTPGSRFPKLTRTLAKRNQLMCQKLTTLPPAMAERAFQILMANGDDQARAKFRDANSMIVFCRMMLKRGSAAFSVGI